MENEMLQFSMEFHRDFPWKIYEREHKHQFLHLRASCLEMGRVTIPQINTNLYSVFLLLYFISQTQVKMTLSEQFQKVIGKSYKNTGKT
jgi:adenine-specific DNA glycosylase